MFKTNIQVPRDLEVSWAYKFPNTSHELCVKLSFMGRDGQTLCYFLGSDQLSELVSNDERQYNGQHTSDYQVGEEEIVNTWHVR